LITGALLRRRLRDAKEEYRKQDDVFTEFCEQQQDNAEQWKDEVRTWEAAEEGARPKNPFDSPNVGECSRTQNILLYTYDVVQAQQKMMFGINMPSKRRWQKILVSLLFTIFCLVGSLSLFWNLKSSSLYYLIVFLCSFDLMIYPRRRVKVAASHTTASSTSQARTALIERQTRLQRGIASFRSLQATYTPTALRELRKASGSAPLDTTQAIVEDIPLLAPTALIGLGYEVPH